MLKSVQDTLKLTQPSAITALRTAGLQMLNDAGIVAIHLPYGLRKTVFPKTIMISMVDIFMDKKSNALGPRCGNEDKIISNWTDTTE